MGRLFSAGLSLETARGIAGDGPAGDHVAAAAGQIDQMIRDIRAMIFSHATDRNSRPSVPTADRQAPPFGGRAAPGT